MTERSTSKRIGAAAQANSAGSGDAASWPAAPAASATSASFAPQERGVSRRSLVMGTGLGALVGLAAGGVGGAMMRGLPGGRNTSALPSDGTTHPGMAQPDTVQPSSERGSLPTGRTQAGVARPSTPQQHALVTVADIDTAALPATLAALGAAILLLIESPDAALLPDGAADLTVLVGLGPRALAALPRGNALDDLLTMPMFAGDEALDPAHLGGDLLLYLAASDPGVLDPALRALTSLVPGFTPRWSEFGFRGPGEDGVARNPVGFQDGIIIPRGEQELNGKVWIADGPLAGGTVCVIRRFALDTAGFLQLDIDQQNRVIGREKRSGAPLSGGTMRDEADITAKTESGEFIVPIDSHVRAAHPSFTGSDLMLRRSYSFAAHSAAGSDATASASLEQGLVFTAFQKNIRTFIRTQQRMDEVDALMAFARPTATASFAILPGFEEDRPLGSSLT